LQTIYIPIETAGAVSVLPRVSTSAARGGAPVQHVSSHLKDYILFGTVATYGRVTSPRNGAGVQRNTMLMPGALTRSLSHDVVFALIDHDWRRVVGSTARHGAGRLTLIDRGDALMFRLDPTSDHAKAEHLLLMVRCGAVRGASAGYTVQESFWSAAWAAEVVTRADLHEISFLTKHGPADTTSRVLMRESFGGL
jgi:HK97 family phage prohead protease